MSGVSTRMNTPDNRPNSQEPPDGSEGHEGCSCPAPQPNSGIDPWAQTAPPPDHRTRTPTVAPPGAAPTQPSPRVPPPPANGPARRPGLPSEPPPSSALAAGDVAPPNPGQRSLPDLLGKVEPITRRRFVQGLLITGVAGAGIVLASSPTARDEASGDPEPDATGPRQQSGLAGKGLEAAPADQRILVVLELEGGNDGLSTVVPRNIGSYYDLRPGLAIPEEELLEFDTDLGLNPNLVQLSKQRLTLVEGVGPVNGNLSHFEMVRRWEEGDASGTGSIRSGFLARLVDALADGSPMTGLSVSGHTPRFTAAQGSVLSLESANQLDSLTNNDWIYPSFRNGLRTFGGAPLNTEVADSFSQLFAIGDNLDIDLAELNEEDPMIKEGGDLGRQLQTAANLIKADTGVKVVHVQLTGFDTHQDHKYRHGELMKQLDAAVAGFINEMELAGLADRVLVATTSEFGRRVKENNNGLDHGSASTMLLSGPIKTGRLGEPSPLDSLDDDGNLKTTVSFDRYLATLAQTWFGIEAAAVLPNSPEPFELF